MAGICKRCNGETTDTRARTGKGECFGCEHNPCRGTIDGCHLRRRECNQKYLHGDSKDLEAIMNKRMRVAFPTEEQATAFIQGVEYLDDDHVMTEGPEADLDSEGAIEYAVFIRRFA